MSDHSKSPHGVMEGKGAYNAHAKLPADGAALALPLLEKAIQKVRLSSGDDPIVVADYGSSQGKNSMTPMRAAIQGLRKRIGPHRPISVFHIDQPSNDFNSLFEVLETDSSRYAVDDRHVYPAAIGRSFYEVVVPPGSVHLGWSCYAAVWLSRLPALIPGHFISIRGSEAVRREFDRQGIEDWKTFLKLRGQEMCPGGRLVVVLPGIGNDGSVGLEPIFDEANAVLEEMVADGAITSGERSKMALRAHPRRQRDLLAPFQPQGKFQQFTLEDFVTSEVTDGAWDQYERDGDPELLSTKRALFFRAVFVPSLACALDPTPARNGNGTGRFGDEVEKRLKRRLANHLLPMRSLAQTIVLAKQD